MQPVLDLVPDAKYPLELVEADLSDKDCWGPAVSGCSYVFHVASPNPTPDETPEDENELIRPAVDGVVNVFTACSKCETVKRVVLTSSTAAVCGYSGIPGRPSDCEYNEDDWAVEENIGAYEKSKLKAERTAWDFVKDDKKFELVVVNPSYIHGPLLSAASGSVSALVAVMLLEQQESLWSFCEGVVDVRDVATAEIAAMFTPSAAGKRFILSGGSMNSKDFTEIIRKEFEPQGYAVPTSDEPGLIKYTFNNERMKIELGVSPRPIEQAIRDTCYTAIQFGLVSKKT